ncbi:MAG: homoserine O-acetyltransferase [Paraglaciecola sp.]|jgi:homoserine O-acetyltransferase
MTSTLLSPKTLEYKLDKPILLEGGTTLSNISVTYTTLGTLNRDKSNVIWVFHALTANSNPLDWWNSLFNSDSFFNPDKDFLICANALGSCYGTTGPDAMDFPLLTIRDIVAVHQNLRDHLHIEKARVGIGGSLGGQQLLEWAVQEPTFFDQIVPIATNASHSPWGIAFNEVQRMALESIDSGKGLEVARAIAMLSYRSYQSFEKTQKDSDQRWDQFRSASYVRYQGEKLRKRFTNQSYFYLSKAMDSHNIGRHALSVEAALSSIQSKATVIGVDSDILFPVAEQQLLAQHMPYATYNEIKSDFGHDGFLIETDQLTSILNKTL